MKANILFNIYETTKRNEAPDLTIGLAMFKAEHPEVEMSHEDEKSVREFMGKHYDVLTKAFVEGPEAFEKAVASCENQEECDCADGAR